MIVLAILDKWNMARVVERCATEEEAGARLQVLLPQLIRGESVRVHYEMAQVFAKPEREPA